MRRVVMKEYQLLRACLLGHRRGLLPGAVSPSAPPGVLLGRELRVKDQYLGPLRNLQQDAVKLGIAVFQIAGKDQLAASMSECVPMAPLRMVQWKTAHLHSAKLEFLALDVNKVAFGGQKRNSTGK